MWLFGHDALNSVALEALDALDAEASASVQAVEAVQLDSADGADGASGASTADGTGFARTWTTGTTWTRSKCHRRSAAVQSFGFLLTKGCIMSRRFKVACGFKMFQVASGGIVLKCPYSFNILQHTLNQTTKGDAVTIVTHREIKSSCRK